MWANLQLRVHPEPSCRKRCWKKLHSKVEVFKFLSGLKINTFCLKLLSGSTSTLCGSWMALLWEYVNCVTTDVLYGTDLRTNTPKGDLHCMFLACAAVCLVRYGSRFPVGFVLDEDRGNAATSSWRKKLRNLRLHEPVASSRGSVI